MFSFNPISAAPFSAVVSNNVTPALSGVVAIGNPGNETAPIPLTGIKASGFAGILYYANNIGWGEAGWGIPPWGGGIQSLSVFSTGSAGRLTPSIRPTNSLTGSFAAGRAGTIAINYPESATGLSATGLLGSMSASAWADINDSQSPNWTPITTN